MVRFPDDPPDWRTASDVRRATAVRRRERAILLLSAVAVVIAATVAFVVPMLITG